MYMALKHLHMLCAVISIAGFALRGGLRLMDSPVLQRKWIKIVPHVIDTVLLATAIGLVIVLHQYPFVTGWVTAKLLGLIVYISLGVATMRIARTQSARVATYLLALLTAAYIVAVAFSKSAFPFL